MRSNNPAPSPFNEKPKSKIIVAGSVAAVVASLALIIYYIVVPSRSFFHADCTDSMFWALASYDSKSVFNPDFNYAALLPFGASIWYIPLISLFGVTMKTQIIAMVIFAVVFTLAIVFLCRSLKMSAPWCAASVFAMLLTMSASEKLRELMWEHTIYYSLGLLLLFVMLGLTVRFIDSIQSTDSSKARLLVFLILLFVFSACVATDGLQIIIICILPVLGAVFAERFFDGETGSLSRKKTNGCLFAIFIAFLGSCLGLILQNLLANGVTAGYENAYSTYDGVEAWVENALDFVVQYATLFGVEIEHGEALFTIDSVVNMIILGAGVIFIIAPFILLFNYKKLDRNTKLVLWSHLIVSAVIMFGFVIGNLGNCCWRITPMVGSSVFTTVVCIRWLISRKNVELRVGALLSVVLVLACLFNAWHVVSLPKDYENQNKLYAVAEALEDRGLEYGYATFWNANSTTVISDSKVTIRSISVNEDGYSKYTYQQLGSWYDNQEGVSKYFMLLTDSEYQMLSNTDDFRYLTLYLSESFDINNYKVFVFTRNIWLGE